MSEGEDGAEEKKRMGGRGLVIILIPSLATAGVRPECRIVKMASLRLTSACLAGWCVCLGGHWMGNIELPLLTH